MFEMEIYIVLFLWYFSDSLEKYGGFYEEIKCSLIIWSGEYKYKKLGNEIKYFYWEYI